MTTSMPLMTRVLIEHQDRLTLMIARLFTQRVALDHASARIQGIPGYVLELGLGKGRTYDRLRRLLPQRDIFAFDRSVHCADEVRPGSDRLVLGEMVSTLREFWQTHGACAALVHADIGSNDPVADRATVEQIKPLIKSLLLDGAIVVCDRPMPDPAWRGLEWQLPARIGVGDLNDAAQWLDLNAESISWPYYLYQAEGTAKSIE